MTGEPDGADSCGAPLRAQDAIFVHEVTPDVAKHLGAVLMLDELASSTPLEVLTELLIRRIAARAPRLPMLARRLHAAPGTWPAWSPVAEITAEAHCTTTTIGAGHRTPDWQAAVTEFLGAPLPSDRPPWMVRLVREADTARTAVLAKTHHALGDGVAMTDTLIRLFSDAEPRFPIRTRDDSGASAGPRAAGLRARARRAGTILRGLAGLAPIGVRRPAGLVGPGSDHRRYAVLELPAVDVRAMARAYAASTTAVLLAIVAGALHRLRDKHGESAVDTPLRTMLPRSTRSVRFGAEGGNFTAALALELPVGPMPAPRRLEHVAERLAALDRGGQAAAITAVLSALGRLPVPLQLRLVGLIAGRRFFDLIVSVLPGSRRVHRIGGATVAAVYPMLPLGRARLAVGLISWADVIGVGVTADATFLPDADELTDCVQASFAELRNAAQAR